MEVGLKGFITQNEFLITLKNSHMNFDESELFL